MGIAGIGIWQLLIVLTIVFMLFGSKRIRHLGSDLGGAIKSFRQAMSDNVSGNSADQQSISTSSRLSGEAPTQ